MGTVFSLKNIGCEFGANRILSDVTFNVYDNDRIGIVGDNGCGKTTLLNILASLTDDVSVDKGSIMRSSAQTLGYLLQSTGGDSRDITVYDDYLEVFAPLIELENEIAALEGDLSEEGAARLAKLYDRFTEMGGLTYKSRLKSTLCGLKFTEEMQKLPVKDLSGGQKVRLALGKLLLKNPDVLLLDEPTNHLDTDSTAFLEDCLKNYSGTVIVVSHDRYFLDTVTTKTVFIDNDGYGTLYNAPYSKFKELREADLEYKRRLYKRQQREIAHINDVIKTQTMWSMEHNYVTIEAWKKKLDRMELIEDPSKVTENLPSISFEAAERGGNDVLLCENLSFAYPGSEPLFSGFSLDLKRGERLVINGKNGGGKTTLLKLIVGLLVPTSGRLKLGGNISFSYYSQNFSDLSLTETPFEEVFDAANKDYYQNQGGLPKFVNIYRVRSALAAFGFSGDDCFKPASVLSGGEKARLSMLKLTYNKANLLILDEPTNHLDIKTCEILEDALLNFDGTVICVSHDRYFTGKIATRTINLDDYKCAPVESSAPAVQVTEAKNDFIKAKEAKANHKKLAKQKETLEVKMSDIEAKIKELDLFLSSDSSDYSKVQEAFELQNKLKNELDEAELTYLETIEALEALT